MNLRNDISSLYGFRVTALRPLDDVNQRLFDIRFEQGKIKGRGVLRVYYDWVDPKDVEAETVWLTSLSSQTRLCVPSPIAARDGTYIQKIKLHGNPEADIAVLHSWVPGAHPLEAITAQQVKEVGRALALLHNHSSLIMKQEVVPSQRQGFQVWVEDWSAANQVADDASIVLENAGGLLESFFDSIAGRADACGFIHCDPHPWNIIFDGDEVGVIDFSDCGWAPFEYDIASALVYYKYPWVWDNETNFDYDALETALLDGYASERRLPQELAQLVPVCFAARLLVLVQWILDDLGSIDATPWTRGAVSRSIEHLRQFCSEYAQDRR